MRSTTASSLPCRSNMLVSGLRRAGPRTIFAGPQYFQSSLGAAPADPAFSMSSLLTVEQARRIVLLAVLVLASACRPAEQASDVDAATPDPTDSTASGLALNLPDSTRATSDAADRLIQHADGEGPIDSSAVAAGLDSIRVQIARLETRLRPYRAGLQTTDDDSSRAAKSSGTRGQFRETAEDVSNFGLRTFWAVVVVGIAFFLIKGIVWIFETLAERSATRRLFFKKLIPISRILVWLVVVYYVVAGIYEVDKDGLLAAGAAVGVAIGFAAQDVLKNIFGGILIIMDQPFQVGDRVRVGGTYGEVVSIGLRSTRIVTPDDNLVSVPNTQVVDGQVANANAGALDCQVVTTLYLPGWVDVARAKQIAYDAAANSKYVYLKKPLVVLVKDDFRETFLTQIIVKAYVLDARFEAAFASDITETAKSQYLAEGLLVEFYPGNARAAHDPAGKEVDRRASRTPRVRQQTSRNPSPEQHPVETVNGNARTPGQPTRRS